MAAVQRLLRAAASGGSAMAAAARRRMASLATEQAPSAAAGFSFAAEERVRQRPMAERNVQWAFLCCPASGCGWSRLTCWTMEALCPRSLAVRVSSMLPALSPPANPPTLSTFYHSNFLQVDIIAPAVIGTLKVLKACYKAKVKRVVVEWYFLSKTLAEHEAFAYAAKTGLDIVTVCPSLVIGPLLQPTVNTSVKIFFSYIKGDQAAVNNGPKNLVDVRDVADALLLAYENPQASGRYLCSSPAIRVSDIVNIPKTSYPTYTYPQNGCSWAARASCRASSACPTSRRALLHRATCCSGESETPLRTSRVQIGPVLLCADLDFVFSRVDQRHG
ncbi:unnamed protein product [Miscanthus lutarioriparius]|uniref:NAD-dependent epimerase/dehydratase domain-containing protein n=1 Tax=Miscanthus lutarioriparius TaxID=422564 RepID=A0A811S817_9POAL|nr:unnamed protein product [Miscanthus lutarioriparius]